MNYQIFGDDFRIPRIQVRRGHVALDFSKAAIDQFWSDVDQKYPGLSEARGCYIFAVRAGRGARPWYVGQSKGPFRKECFQPHKQSHYHHAFNRIRRGTPILIFTARCTAGGKLSKRTLARSEVDFVEKLLISLAVTQNGQLLNKKDTKLLRELKLPGILNSPPGKPSASTSMLRTTLGV